MCVVATGAAAVFEYVALAAAVVGTAYSMDQAHKAAQYNEQVALNNKKLDDQQATNANAMGSYAADQARIRTNLMRGQQMAAFAANNVDVQTGTAADVLGDTAMFGEVDQRQARTNAAQRAYGFQVQALNDLGNAQYAKWQGKTQQTSLFLQGVSSAAGSMSRTGAFSGGGAGTSSFAGGGNTVMTGGPYNGPGTMNYNSFGTYP